MAKSAALLALLCTHLMPHLQRGQHMPFFDALACPSTCCRRHAGRPSSPSKHVSRRPVACYSFGAPSPCFGGTCNRLGEQVVGGGSL